MQGRATPTGHEYLQVVSEVVYPLSIQELPGKRQWPGMVQHTPHPPSVLSSYPHTFIPSYLHTHMSPYLPDHIRWFQFSNCQYVLSDGTVEVPFTVGRGTECRRSLLPSLSPSLLSPSHL